MTGTEPPGSRSTDRRGVWSGSFVAIVALAALVQGVVHAVRLVASYRALELGAGAFEVGLIASAYGAVALIAAVPVGRLVDRHGEAPFVVLASLTLAVGAAVVLLGDSLALLAVSQGAVGLGHLLSVVAAQTLVASRGGSAGRSARFGFYAAGASLGQLVGPVVGALVISAAGGGAALPGVAVVTAMVLTIATLATWLLRTERRRSAAAPRPVSTPHVAMSGILRWPGMPLAMTASVSLNLGVDTLVVFMPLYAEARGIPVEAVGLLLAVRAGASLAIRLFTGPLVTRLGPDRTLLGATLVSAVAIAAITLTGDVGMMAALMVLAGVGLGLGAPMTLAWVTSVAPSGSRGTAIAVRVSGNRFGQMVAPSLLGAIAGPAGVAGAFLALAGLLGGVGAMLLRTPLPRDAA